VKSEVVFWFIEYACKTLVLGFVWKEIYRIEASLSRDPCMCAYTWLHTNIVRNGDDGVHDEISHLIISRSTHVGTRHEVLLYHELVRAYYKLSKHLKRERSFCFYNYVPYVIFSMDSIKAIAVQVQLAMMHHHCWLKLIKVMYEVLNKYYYSDSWIPN